MFKTLKRWWQEESDTQGDAPELSLAVTKLMVGMMSIDGKIDAAEHDEILRLLKKSYNISTQESDELIEQCVNGDAAKIRFDQIVAQINKHYDVQQRTQVLRKIWQVALADGEIDFLEEQYINRLSGLLTVPMKSLTEVKKK